MCPKSSDPFYIISYYEERQRNLHNMGKRHNTRKLNSEILTNFPSVATVFMKVIQNECTNIFFNPSPPQKVAISTSLADFKYTQKGSSYFHNNPMLAPDANTNFQQRLNLMNHSKLDQLNKYHKSDSVQKSVTMLGC